MKPKMNYDPNVNFCTQIVELRLQQWHYTAKEVVEVRGNVKGVAVLRAAIGALYGKLELSDDGIRHLTLKQGRGVLYCYHEEGHDGDWLGELVVGFRIVAIIPDRERTSAIA